MINTVSIIDGDDTQEVLEINDARFGVFKRIAGYNDKCTALYVRFVEVAYDWNMSNRITIEAKGLDQLVRKIEKEQYRIVKP